MAALPPPFARGRDATVHPHGPGLVLRRYARPGPTEREAALMRHLRSAGYPVPDVCGATS